ncbi:MAG: hypothetical protein LBI60_03170 [Bacteroidales bacterium]|jgi:hypothetical protein|nr:hypothetical protein [Bacteroidales bacterium]
MKRKILFMKKILPVSVLLLLFCLSGCKDKTKENVIRGQIYYEISVNKEIIGDCTMKLYKAEGVPINLVTAQPTYTTTSDAKSHYEFKTIPDGAWWLRASVNYVDTTDIIREKYTCEKTIGLFELSGNTKQDIDIYLELP